MKTAIALVLPLLALAACNKGDATGNAPPAATGATAAAAATKPPAGQQWTDVVVKTPDNGFRMGNPNAPVKLVEYGSRTCPVCGMFGREGFQPLQQNYVKSGKVSFEFREYMVHGQPDVPASLLGICAGPAVFFPMLEQMYQAQAPIEEKLGSPEGQALFQKMANAKPVDVANAWADYLGYIDFVKQRGIPETKARACLADTKALDRISAGMRDADSKGVTGTPSFFINGQKADAITWSQLEPALKAAGA
jgi:protein-disulfide isomerase